MAPSPYRRTPPTPSVIPPSPAESSGSAIIHIGKDFDTPPIGPDPDHSYDYDHDYDDHDHDHDQKYASHEMQELPSIPVNEERRGGVGLGLDQGSFEPAVLAAQAGTREPDYSPKRHPSSFDGWRTSTPSAPPQLPQPQPPPPRPSLPSRPPSLAGDGGSLRPITSATSRFSLGAMDQARRVKYGTGKHAGVELVPQPSDSADDPLNWSRLRKDANLGILLVTVSIINAMKTALIPVNGVAAVHYNVSYTAAASLTAVPLVLGSFSGLAATTAARIWGRRPVYLVALATVLIGSIWNACAGQHFTDAMGARVFQGLGWGAFDVLLLGAIQDLYFEHERDLIVGVCDTVAALTTWGPPLIGGIASQNAGSYVVQFQITTAFLAAVLVAYVLCGAETAYDRGAANRADDATSPHPPPPPPQSQSPPPPPRGSVSARIMMGHASRARVGEYRGKISVRVAAQAARAYVTPTVGLVFLATFLPYGALWALVETVALLFSTLPLRQTPADLGGIMAGPFIMAVLAVAAVSLYLVRAGAARVRPVALTVAAGTVLSFIGLLAYGLDIRHVLGGPGPAHRSGAELSFPLLSILLGFLAAGTHVLLLAQRPVIARSCQFTCANVATRLRVEADMTAGAAFWRGIMAGVFVMAAPNAIGGAVGMGLTGGLRGLVVGAATAEILVVAGCAAVWWLYGDALKRWDGQVMGLVNLTELKRSGSFFDFD